MEKVDFIKQKLISEYSSIKVLDPETNIDDYLSDLSYSYSDEIWLYIFDPNSGIFLGLEDPKENAKSSSEHYIRGEYDFHLIGAIGVYYDAEEGLIDSTSNIDFCVNLLPDTIIFELNYEVGMAEVAQFIRDTLLEYKDLATKLTISSPVTLIKEDKDPSQKGQSYNTLFKI